MNNLLHPTGAFQKETPSSCEEAPALTGAPHETEQLFHYHNQNWNQDEDFRWALIALSMDELREWLCGREVQS